MSKRVLFAFICIVAVQAETEVKKELIIEDIIKVVGGLVLMLIAGLIYAYQNCRKTAIVEFESFEETNPTPGDIISDAKGKDLATFSTDAMKEPSFDSIDSPAEHKRRKRKAHRLSDRRRN